MMFVYPSNDPYVHDDSSYWYNWGGMPWKPWNELVKDLNENGIFHELMKITPVPKRIMNHRNLIDQIKQQNKKDNMDIERIKKYTQQLKTLETKLNELEGQLEEKKIDLDQILSKVHEGYIHPGVERGMEYGIKMAQLFAKDADIPGKAEALKAMSMSYALSEKYNEWEKVAYQYALTKQQLDSLKRNYADLKDTLVEALKCFDEAVENTEKTE